MKNFLLGLFLLPVFCFGQTSVISVGTGEYDCYFINSAGKLYDLVFALPNAVANLPSNLTFKSVAGGLHNAAAIDNQGHVWTLGDNSAGVAGNGSTNGTSSPSQVMTDSSGRVFDSVVQVALWFTTGTGILAVKSTGTLWIWGNLDAGFRGTGALSGTYTKPVQVVIPGNRKVIKVCVDNTIEVLCSDGTVWAWGSNIPMVLGTNNADCTRPHQVPLPQAAKDIACGGLWNYAVGANGTLYGWGFYSNAMFGSFTGPAQATPLDLTKYMNFPAPVAKVYVNTVCNYFILTDGSLWSSGVNTVGGLGNGRQADQAKSVAPYAIWSDPSSSGQLLEPIPTHLMPGVKFSNVYVATADVFYFYAQDVNGQLYSAGRNKGGVLGNGVRECDWMQGAIGSMYPNSWDQPTLTAVNPLALTSATGVTSPICNTGNNQNTSPCNLCSVQPISTPTANAGSNQTITLPTSQVTLNGTASTVKGGTIAKYVWSQQTGPSKAVIAAAGSATTVVTGLIAGTYAFTLTIMDNNGNTSTATVQVTVNAAVVTPPVTISQAIPGVVQGESYSAMSGVQKETTTDAGGGQDVGWIDNGDWMDYSVNVVTAGTYAVSFRVATPNTGASFQLRNSSGAILATMNPTNSGGFQNWETVTANVTLPAGVQTLRVYSATTNQWNLNWIQFAAVQPAAQPIPGTIKGVSYSTMSGVDKQTTTDAGGGQNVDWIDNGDWMDYAVNVAAAGTYTVGFRVATPNTGASLQLRNSSGTVLTTVNLASTGGWQSWQTVNASVTLPVGVQTLRVYSATAVQWNFNWMQFGAVQPAAQAIPGKIEAESYDSMSGIQTQSTTDAGGGLNVGWIDNKDWMGYNVNVATAGTYTASFRVATPYTGASFQLRNASGTVLATLNPPNSGGFQTWETVTANVTLPAGVQTLQIYSTTSGVQWNFNWMQFTSGSSASSVQTAAVNAASEHLLTDSTAGASDAPSSIVLYPNPVQSAFTIQLDNEHMGNMLVQVVDASGTVRQLYKFNKDLPSIQVNLSVGNLPSGIYFVRVQIGKWSVTKKMSKL